MDLIPDLSLVLVSALFPKLDRNYVPFFCDYVQCTVGQVGIMRQSGRSAIEMDAVLERTVGVVRASLPINDAG